MWVNKTLFQTVLDDNKAQAESLTQGRVEMGKALATVQEMRAQKAKDDMTIDWMRHRVNALEKQNAILLQKAAGVSLPIPEIVPSRPGTLSPTFDSMPSFEDAGDAEAERLGLAHDDLGFLRFNDNPRPASMTGQATSA